MGRVGILLTHCVVGGLLRTQSVKVDYYIRSQKTYYKRTDANILVILACLYARTLHACFVRDDIFRGAYSTIPVHLCSAVIYVRKRLQRVAFKQVPLTSHRDTTYSTVP